MNTVAQYFEAVTAERIDAMTILRNTIFEVFPNAIENMDYKLPTYKNNGLKVCAIASQKNYMALYIMNYDLLDHFKEELSSLNCGKSCIRFKELDSETQLLFRKILIYIKENITKSQFYKR